MRPSAEPSCSPSSFPSSQPTIIPRCNAGSYYAFNSSSPLDYDCKTCPEGYFSAANSHKCSACQPGTFSGPGSVTCDVCPFNSYQGAEAQSSCILCPGGYVTGSTASTTRAACINPTVNFIVGAISLIVSMVSISTYVFHGRLLRIAFYRYHRLVKKGIRGCGLVLRSIDMVNSLARILTTIHRRARIETNFQKYVLRPLLFVILGTLLSLVVVFVVVLSALLHIVFNTLVLWRGYRLFNLPLSFANELTLLVSIIDNYLGIGIFRVIATPFILALTFLASIHVNLNAVQVTCAGSQAPIYLFINLVIAGVVVIVIKSDLQVYWSAALTQVLQQSSTLVFCRSYFIERKLGAIWDLIWSVGVLCLPSPRKWIQYGLGLATFGVFIGSGGIAGSNSNCNVAYSLPVDQMLAMGTSILAYAVLFPMIYLVAQVLVPCFNRASNLGNSYKLPDIQFEDEDTSMLTRTIRQTKRYLVCFLRLLTIPLSLDWFVVKSVHSHIESMSTRYKKFLTQEHEERSRGDFNDVEKIDNIHAEANEAEFIDVPWLAAVQDMTEAAAIEREAEKQLWRGHKREFMSYIDLSKRCYQEWTLTDSFLGSQLVFKSLSYLIVFQMQTKVGFSIWTRVFKNYLSLVLVSLGVWTDLDVDEFKLLENFDHYKDAIGSSRKEYNNVFSRIANDEKILLVNYMSSVVSPRSVLLQLVPVLTVWSIFSVDMSRSPLFVFSSRLEESLPPLMATNALADARTLLSNELGREHKDLPSWKVASLSSFIFMTHSRLVQFALSLVKFLISCGLVFFPGSMVYLVALMLFVFVIVGVVTALSMLLLLDKFLFPDDDLKSPPATPPPPPVLKKSPLFTRHESKSSHDQDPDLEMHSLYKEAPSVVVSVNPDRRRIRPKRRPPSAGFM